MRNLLTIFALFAFAALASANPPQARAVYCPPAAVYAPPARVRLVEVPQRVYYPPQAVVDPCAGQLLLDTGDYHSLRAAQVEYRQNVRLRLEQPSYYYAQPARQSLNVYYPQPARFAELGGGVPVIRRREGLFERLGNRQSDRRDSQALRRSGQPEALIIRR